MVKTKWGPHNMTKFVSRNYVEISLYQFKTNIFSFVFTQRILNKTRSPAWCEEKVNWERESVSPCIDFRDPLNLSVLQVYECRH